MDELEALQLARDRYLDDRNIYGCAETAFIVLKACYGLDNATDSSAAMVLNGGIAYSGGMCGAISGSAMAVGMLAERRIPDHAVAKGVARGITTRLLDDFRREFGAVDCRDLLGYELREPGRHAAFIASGAWRDGCMRQVEFAVRALARMATEEAWTAAVTEHAKPRP